jgi:hypothetical protein
VCNDAAIPSDDTLGHKIFLIDHQTDLCQSGVTGLVEQECKPARGMALPPIGRANVVANMPSILIVGWLQLGTQAEFSDNHIARSHEHIGPLRRYAIRQADTLCLIVEFLYERGEVYLRKGIVVIGIAFDRGQMFYHHGHVGSTVMECNTF